jgi:hypothetical protein
MKALLLVAIALFPLSVFGAEQGITNNPSETFPAGPGGMTVPGLPQRTESATGVYSVETERHLAWEHIDSMNLHMMIPGTESFCVFFDYSEEALRCTLLSDSLTPLANQALDKAPDWLKLDLKDNFRRMGRLHQDIYADLILTCPDKRYYDEVCFQVAHLSPQTLIYGSFDPNLVVENAHWIYEVDPDLEYVTIVDYGDPDAGGDYYSTTSYRFLDQVGDTGEMEIPRDIYYWWVVSPKVSDELPRMDAAVYDYFWREYLYTQADSGYPLLDTALVYAHVLWDGMRRDLPPSRPFADSCTALDIVGNWTTRTVPFAASGNRPHQPNVIAHEHNGNCGELQDLLCAAARTALIPTVCTHDINEDHVWNAFWWDGDWRPYQVDLGFSPTHINNPRIAYDRDFGGSKDCSAIWNWRMDGYQWSDVERYSKSCTLSVIVQDRNGEPVDGALVKLFSEMWPQSPSILYQCFNGATNQYGVFTTTLGDHQNYYVSIESPMGYTSAEMIIDSTEAIPGRHIYWVRNLDGEMPKLSVSPDSLPDNPKQDYMVEVIYRLVDQTVYGIDCYNDYGNNQWAYKLYPGVVDFFLTDEANFDRFLGDMEFDSYKIFRKLDRGFTWLVLPTNEDYFCVFSNAEHLNLAQSLNVTVNLYRNTNIGIAADKPIRRRADPKLVASPNPFRASSSILIGGVRGADSELEIHDAAGRLVRRLPVPGTEDSVVLEWDGNDSNGRSLPDGIYFLGLSGMSSEARAKVVRIR